MIRARRSWMIVGGLALLVVATAIGIGATVGRGVIHMVEPSITDAQSDIVRDTEADAQAQTGELNTCIDLRALEQGATGGGRRKIERAIAEHHCPDHPGAKP